MKIGQVSYLNTLPVYCGLEQGAVAKEEGWTFIEGTPSALNSKLSSGELDISVVSSVEYARHWRDYCILPHLCIGSDGEVKSVLFFSKVPLKELEGKEVWLTKSSLTSKTLVRWIFEEMGVTPLYREFALGEEVFLNAHTQAVLLIGDEALKKRESGAFPYILDLGAYWKEKTGLPFVFALWCVRKTVVQSHPQEVTRVWQALLSSREYSMSRLEEISRLYHRQVGLSQDQCKDYLRGLDFDLTPAHIKGMKLFFSMLKERSLIPQDPPLNFFPLLEDEP